MITRFIRYITPWRISVYLIWPYQCKREKHFIATILDKASKPDYKRCMRCHTRFDLSYIGKGRYS